MAAARASRVKLRRLEKTRSSLKAGLLGGLRRFGAGDLFLQRGDMLGEIADRPAIILAWRQGPFRPLCAVFIVHSLITSRFLAAWSFDPGRKRDYINQ